MDNFEAKFQKPEVGDGNGYTIKQFEQLQKAHKIENPDAQKEIFEKHFNEAFLWLERYHQAVLMERGDESTRKLVEENLDHTRRVGDLAEWIGGGEKKHISGGAYEQDQFARKLKLAAIFHDIVKLNPAEDDAVDAEHHKNGAELASGLLQLKIGLTPEVAHEIKQAIAAHSRDGIVEPETLLDYALRDADILDQMDVWGLKKMVEFRQNPKSEFYREDGGDVNKAVEAALRSIEAASPLLYTDTAKKIAETFDKRRNEFLAFLKGQNILNLEDFRKVFRKFLESKTRK